MSASNFAVNSWQWGQGVGVGRSISSEILISEIQTLPYTQAVCSPHSHSQKIKKKRKMLYFSTAFLLKDRSIADRNHLL